MITALKVTKLQTAIKHYDSNYIKNLYLYNKDLYFELCKQIAIIQAFCNAQYKSQKKFDDTKLNFWKTIHYINTLECSDDQKLYLPVELRILPQVYLTIIDEINMDTNKAEYLKQHTPLWKTLNSFIVFGSLAFCVGGASVSIYKLSHQLQIQNLINEVYKFALMVLADPNQLNMFVNFAILISTTCMFCLISKADYTKEYVCNFVDWTVYKYNCFLKKNDNITYQINEQQHNIK